MIDLCTSPPLSDDWFETRRAGITATDISVVLGVNPWRTQTDLWLDKRGEADPVPDNTAMRVGRAVEPAIIDLATDDLGTVLTYPSIPSIYGASGSPLLRASLDGLGVDGCPVEAKATRFMWQELPAHVEAQARMQAGVVGADHTTVCVLAGTDYEQWTVKHDQDWWDWAESEAHDWWQRHVMDGERPPAESGDDMQTRFTPDAAVSAAISPMEWDAYVSAREIAEDAKRLLAELQTRVQDQVGDATTVTVNNRKVATWNARKGRASLNQKALKAAYPEIVAKFTSTGGGGRTWRLAR